MKQINPFELHSEGLYRVCELQVRASRDKIAFETKLSSRVARAQVIGKRGWGGHFHFGN